MVNEGQQNSSIPIGHASPVLPSSFLLQQDNFNPFLQNSEKSSETRTKGVSGSFDNGIGSLDSFKLNPETDWRVQSRQSKSRANLLSMGGGGNNEELPFASLSLHQSQLATQARYCQAAFYYSRIISILFCKIPRRVVKLERKE